MKAIIATLILLLVGIMAWTQNDVEVITTHEVPWVVSDTVWSSELDSVVLQFPTRDNTASITQLKDQAISSVWTVANEATLWAGFLEIDYMLTNIDISNTDSLEMKVYVLDGAGNVISNDYVWARFTTQPYFSSTQKILDWTTATRYRASLTGAFGEGTHGLLILTDINEETASQESKFDLSVNID